MGQALGIAALYAATDEIHQYFVPGWACMFTDVCIDSVGALLGVLFATVILVSFEHSQSLRKERI